MASADKCILFKLNNLCMRTQELPADLKALLESKVVTKVGFCIRNDMNTINYLHGIKVLHLVS